MCKWFIVPKETKHGDELVSDNNFYPFTNKQGEQSFAQLKDGKIRLIIRIAHRMAPDAVHRLTYSEITGYGIGCPERLVYASAVPTEKEKVKTKGRACNGRDKVGQLSERSFRNELLKFGGMTPEFINELIAMFATGRSTIEETAKQKAMAIYKFAKAA